jgi:hypothetical protein
MDGGVNFGAILRGLIIEGGGEDTGGIGIYANNVPNLVLHDCLIRGFGFGLQQVTPGSSTSLNNSVLLGCKNAFYLHISSGGAAAANVNHCRFELNGNSGLDTENSGSSAVVTVTVADSLFYRNAQGITNSVGGGAGANSKVLVSNSVITDNATGIFGNGGQVLSRGNNTLTNNGAGNVFDGTYGAQ